MISVRLPNNAVIKITYRWQIIDLFIPRSVYFTLKDKIYISNREPLEALPLPILIHENRHTEQQKAYGLCYFLFKYFTSKKFRLKMEAEAFALQIKSITSVGERKAILHNAATWLSGKQYFWCASYEEAKNAILYRCPSTLFL
jgi:hypothetical protein